MKKIILTALILFSPISILAETITFKSGKVIEGEISNRTDDFIKVDEGLGITLTYYLDEIESIDETGKNSKENSIKESTSKEGDWAKDMKEGINEYFQEGIKAKGVFVNGKQEGFHRVYDKETGLLSLILYYSDGEVWGIGAVGLYPDQETDEKMALVGSFCKMLSEKIEVFVAKNEGFYPKGMDELVAFYPYFKYENYCDQSWQGYDISCELSAAGYQIKAVPNMELTKPGGTFIYSTGKTTSVEGRSEQYSAELMQRQSDYEKKNKVDFAEQKLKTYKELLEKYKNPMKVIDTQEGDILLADKSVVNMLDQGIDFQKSLELSEYIAQAVMAQNKLIEVRLPEFSKFINSLHSGPFYQQKDKTYRDVGALIFVDGELINSRFIPSKHANMSNFTSDDYKRYQAMYDAGENWEEKSIGGGDSGEESTIVQESNEAREPIFTSTGEILKLTEEEKEMCEQYINKDPRIWKNPIFDEQPELALKYALVNFDADDVKDRWKARKLAIFYSSGEVKTNAFLEAILLKKILQVDTEKDQSYTEAYPSDTGRWDKSAFNRQMRYASMLWELGDEDAIPYIEEVFEGYETEKFPFPDEFDIQRLVDNPSMLLERVYQKLLKADPFKYRVYNHQKVKAALVLHQFGNEEGKKWIMEQASEKLTDVGLVRASFEIGDEEFKEAATAALLDEMRAAEKCNKGTPQACILAENGNEEGLEFVRQCFEKLKFMTGGCELEVLDKSYVIEELKTTLTDKLRREPLPEVFDGFMIVPLRREIIATLLESEGKSALPLILKGLKEDAVDATRKAIIINQIKEYDAREEVSYIEEAIEEETYRYRNFVQQWEANSKEEKVQFFSAAGGYLRPFEPDLIQKWIDILKEWQVDSAQEFEQSLQDEAEHYRKVASGVSLEGEYEKRFSVVDGVVYYLLLPIDWIDGATFKIHAGGMFISDKNGVYEGLVNKVEGADPKTFACGWDVCKDENGFERKIR